VANSKLPRFNLRSARGEWRLVVAPVEGAVEGRPIVVGLVAPNAYEVRMVTVWIESVSLLNLENLVRCAIRAPMNGPPGSPARIVVPAEALAASIRERTKGIAVIVDPWVDDHGTAAAMLAAIPYVEAALLDPALDVTTDERRQLERILEALEQNAESNPLVDFDELADVGD